MSELSLYHHWSTLSAIDRAGDRMHSGLMSLATSQAKAMGELGRRIDDGLVQIDRAVLEQNNRLNRIDTALDGLRSDMRTGFVRISEQMSGIDEKLDRIEARVTNPEETRAWERFTRATDLLKKGHVADALEHLTAAIENDGGPAFRHIPQFQLLLGQIRIGDTVPRAPELVDYDAAHRAFRQASLHLEGEQSAVALCRAGAAAFLDGDLDCAIDTYLDALKIPHPYRYTHFEISKCYLEKGMVKHMVHHLKHAIDQDWRLTAMVAIDPIFIKHAELSAQVVGEYRSQIVERLHEGLQALKYVATGPAERNYEKMRSMLNERAETATLDDLDPDMKIISKPAFKHRSVDGDFMEVREPYLGTFEVLTTDDVGLIDIARAFRSDMHVTSNHSRQRNGFLEFVQNQLNAAGAHYYEIKSDLDLCKATNHDDHIRSTLGRCIDKTEEATNLAFSRGGEKPGLLGRLAGKQAARTFPELDSVRHKEMKRLQAEVSKAVKPVVDKVEKGFDRNAEILRTAHKAHNMIQAYLEGEFRFLKPSSTTEPENRQRSMTAAPS